MKNKILNIYFIKILNSMDNHEVQRGQGQIEYYKKYSIKLFEELVIKFRIDNSWNNDEVDVKITSFSNPTFTIVLITNSRTEDQIFFTDSKHVADDFFHDYKEKLIKEGISFERKKIIQ